MTRWMIVAMLLSGMVHLPAVAEVKLQTADGANAIVELPGGGRAKLTLAKVWGRDRGPGTAWSDSRPGKTWAELKKDALPTPKFTTGPDHVQATITFTPETDARIVIVLYELDLSGAKAFHDIDGTRTWLNRSEVQSAAKLLAGEKAFPANWTWPAAPGLTAYVGLATARTFDKQDDGTGFGTEPLKGRKELQLVSHSVIARASEAGGLLGLIADQAITVGLAGPDRLTIACVARNLAKGQPRAMTMRLYCGDGKPSELLPRWAAELDTVPMRAYFCGDSVGQAYGSYAYTLCDRLADTFGTKVRAVNVSCGGATTEWMLNKQFTGDVLAGGGNLVVFQLSYNDAYNAGFRSMTPEKVVANYRAMIDPILAKPGGRVVILSPLSLDKKRLDTVLADGDRRYPKGTDLNKIGGTYIAAIEKMVAEYEASDKSKGRVTFVSIFEALAKARAEKGADTVLLPDGWHPTAEGQKIIADAAWPAVKAAAEATLKDTAEKR